MLPIGPLMVEHRLIERLIRIMAAQLEIIQIEEKNDPVRVGKIVYFIQAYADRCHHGKEENILFRELGRKEISPEHRLIMAGLIEDHKMGRQTTTSISEANQRYQKGEEGVLPVIADGFRRLVEFYPKHIQKEDRGFFLPVMGYFNREELEAMIREGYEADSRLLHKEHEKLVAELNEGGSPAR
jgi:hemerythrin-like domain-containing protein